MVTSTVVTGDKYKTLRRVLLICIVGFSLLAAVERNRSLHRYAESRNCAIQLAAICSAGKVWAGGHEGKFPLNFPSASNELASARILICPSDKARLTGGRACSFADVTYELVSPGVSVSDTNAVFVRCPIHGHLGYPDVTVFDGVRRRREKLP